MTKEGNAGFTLLEVLGVLVITAVIATGTWSVTESITRGQLQSMDDTDRSSAVAAIDRVLRNAVGQATLGTLAAPNAGPIQVVVSAGAGTAADTLVVLRAEAAPMTNSTRGCPAGGSCLYLVGDFSEVIQPGEVLLVSAPAMGARVYRVTGAPRDSRAACGADCPEEVSCPTRQDMAAEAAVVVVSSTYYTAVPATSIERPGLPCEQSYYANGDRCEERRATVTPIRREWTCNPPGRVSAYTEVPVAELTTSTFGFPSAGTAPITSGAALTPRVRTQRVTASRFFVRRDGTRPAPVLVRQTGLDTRGAWNAAAPVAGPISSLVVETLHADENDWVRGVGVDDASLAHNPGGNPNYVYAYTPSINGSPGFYFRRGYHDVAAVRLRFTVPTGQPDGTTLDVPHVTVVSTNGATHGGSEGGW